VAWISIAIVLKSRKQLGFRDGQVTVLAPSRPKHEAFAVRCREGAILTFRRVTLLSHFSTAPCISPPSHPHTFPPRSSTTSGSAPSPRWSLLPYSYCLCFTALTLIDESASLDLVSNGTQVENCRRGNRRLDIVGDDFRSRSDKIVLSVCEGVCVGGGLRGAEECGREGVRGDAMDELVAACLAPAQASRN
jgi:hypothetical protein